ncbi:MAG: DUF4268 domain-containing protein, partial [Proteobacteria bacterium]
PAGEHEPEDDEADGEREALYRKFWEQFLVKANAQGTLFSRRTTSGNRWIGTSLGRNGFRLSVAMTRNETRVACQIHHPDGGSALFDVLHAEREAIEKEFRRVMEWSPLPEQKRSRIRVSVPKGWQLPESEWPDFQMQLVELAYRLDSVLRPRILAIVD